MERPLIKFLFIDELHSCPTELQNMFLTSAISCYQKKVS